LPDTAFDYPRDGAMPGQEQTAREIPPDCPTVWQERRGQPPQRDRFRQHRGRSSRIVGERPPCARRAASREEPSRPPVPPWWWGTTARPSAALALHARHVGPAPGLAV